MSKPTPAPAARSRFDRGWVAIALAAVVGVSAWNVLVVVSRTPARPAVASAAPVDPVTRQERRFARLRAAMVARGISGYVGYVTDAPADAVLGNAARAEDYYLAQFVLVPAVLDLNYAAHAWVVTNHRAAPAPDVPGYELAADGGEGVRLLRRSAR